MSIRNSLTISSERFKAGVLLFPLFLFIGSDKRIEQRHKCILKNCRTVFLCALQTFEYLEKDGTEIKHQGGIIFFEVQYRIELYNLKEENTC